MTVEQSIAEGIRSLSPGQKQEVLDFVEFLQQRGGATRPRKSIEGMCADLGVHVTEEDIAEARHEMWGSFPPEIP